MDLQATSDVETLAKQTAEELAGAGSNVNVLVRVDVDAGYEPAYFFHFDIEHGSALPDQPAVFRLRLIQELRDRLMARGDTKYPFINRLSLRRSPSRADA